MVLNKICGFTMPPKPILLMPICALILYTGCASTKEIQTHLNKKGYPLDYLHDSEKVEEKYHVHVCLTDAVDSSLFNTETIVEKTRGSVVPLLVVYFWNYEYSCTLGTATLEESLVDFIAKAFLKESLRSARYISGLDNNDCDYQLTLTINYHNTGGPYKQAGSLLILPYGYSYSWSELGGPVVTDITLTARMTQADSIVMDKRYSEEQTSMLIRQKGRTAAQYRDHFANSLVESLALAMKQCIEDLVADINIIVAGDSLTVEPLSKAEMDSLSTYPAVSPGYQEEFKEELPAGYLTIHIKGDRRFQGRYMGVHKGYVYLVDDPKLYMIKESLITSILDDGADVTAETLSKRGLRGNVLKYDDVVLIRR
jgi:hypothetical protein